MAPQLLQNSIAYLPRSYYGSIFPPSLWYLAILKQLTHKYVNVGHHWIVEKGSWAISYRPWHFTCLGMRSRSHFTPKNSLLSAPEQHQPFLHNHAAGSRTSQLHEELKLKTCAEISKSLHPCFGRWTQLSKAIHSYTFNQEVPHRAQIYSIEKPLFVMLSPSSVYLYTSTWTNIPTKYNRPLLSKVTYIKLWYQWSDKQDGSNLTEVLKLSHNRRFQSNKSFQSPFQINKINNYKTKMWI